MGDSGAANQNGRRGPDPIGLNFDSRHSSRPNRARESSFLGATGMSSRVAAASLWLVPLTVVVALLWRIDGRVGWDAALAPAAAPEDNGREQRAASVFGLDSSADGDTMLCCRRGQLGRGAPLVMFAADGQPRRLPAAEA